MLRNTALLSLAGSASVMARSLPLGTRDIATTKTMCFDFGDCLIFGAGLASCDHTGNNAQLLGILGTCVTPAASSSSGGLGSLFGLGKRHGPDGDEDEETVVVAVNATAATPAKRQLIGDLVDATSDGISSAASIGSDIIGGGIDAGKDILGSLLSIPGDILGFGSYGYDDKVKRQLLGDLVDATSDGISDAASVGSDIIGSGIDAGKDILGGLLSIPGDILGFGSYGYDDKVKRQLLGDLVDATSDGISDAASVGSDIIGSGIDAGKDILGGLLSIPGDILGFGGYGYDD